MCGFSIRHYYTKPCVFMCSTCHCRRIKSYARSCGKSYEGSLWLRWNSKSKNTFFIRFSEAQHASTSEARRGQVEKPRDGEGDLWWPGQCFTRGGDGMLGCYVSRVTRHAVCRVVTLFKCGHGPTGRDDNAPRLITSHIVHINISFSCLMVSLTLKIVPRSTVLKQQSDLNPAQCSAQLPSVPKLCSHVGSLSGSWGLVTWAGK